MKTLFNEVSLSILLILLIVLFLDPFMFLMPDSVVYVLIAVVVLSFAAFVGLVWKEKAQDERDEFHRMVAGRIGYILGATGLLIGIVWETIFSHPDAWLVVALILMVLGKLIGHYYARMRH